MADQGAGSLTASAAAPGRLPDGLRWAASRLLSTSAFLLAARLAGAAAGFLVQLLLARNLSAEHLGLYFAVTSLMVVAGVVAAHGYPSIATRFVSRYRGAKAAPLLRGFVHHAEAETFVLAALLAAAMAAAGLVWPGESVETGTALLIAAAVVPSVAAFRLYGSLAGANRCFKLAYLPDVCFKPMVLLATLSVAVGLQGGVTVIQVMLLLAGATIVLSLIQVLLLARAFPVALRLQRDRDARQSSHVRRLVPRWRREAHAVLPVAIFAQFFPELSILIATPVLGAAAMGAFGICLKLAFLVGFFVMLTQNMATPDLADALGRRNERTGGRKLSASCLPATVATLGALLLSIFWGEHALRIFGADFASGRTALVMLVTAQLVRAVFGPSNAVLTIIGERKANLLLAVSAMLVLLAGTTVLGLLFGLNGAALAVLATMLFWSGASAWWLNRAAGIRVDLFAAWLRPA
jgi:O-antigen/teichoic acid export membrane protein